MKLVHDNLARAMIRRYARRPTSILGLAALLFLAAALRPVVALASPRAADTVMLNGAILIFQGIERHDGARQPKFAQAVAIADSRIVFIGPSRTAKKNTIRLSAIATA